MDRLKKVESEEVKAEKKRAKEGKEANGCEMSEVVQKQLEEANLLLGSETKKRAKELKEEAKELKEERKRVEVEAKVEAKEQRAKELKEGGEGVALALAALEVPTSKGAKGRLAGIEDAPSGKCD
jgi:hypothetical protein